MELKNAKTSYKLMIFILLPIAITAALKINYDLRVEKYSEISQTDSFPAYKYSEEIRLKESEKYLIEMQLEDVESWFTLKNESGNKYAADRQPGENIEN